MELRRNKNPRHVYDIKRNAEFEEINNAAYMVAGDKNDIFSEAVEKFLVKNN